MPCLAWGYLVFVMATWLAVFLGGDRWWPATVFLFSPRWFVSLPLMVMVPLAAWANRRSLMPLFAAAVIIFGPLMGLCLPLPQAKSVPGPVLRVLTCNVQTGDFNAAALSALIRDSGADIVALQECPPEFRIALPREWQSVQDGELVVLARYPLQKSGSLQALHPPHQWPRTCLLQCVITVPWGKVAFNTVHLPSPRYGLQTILDRTTLFSLSRKGLLIEETAHRKRVAREAQRAVAQSPLPVIVAGDFNMPADSTIYRDVWGRYANAFSEKGTGYGRTEFASMRGIKVGVRIDHILAGNGLGIRVCETGPDVGSDHLPLIADIGGHR
ncbi:endonuclease/exonuclease/phosphatase family protein [Geobacter sp. FeAm09]|uniref:endonuclease/exonuclease/phosphatase family protein n=1 Tax=Geobacter sp. FeAm09 TaxID=2597769 RepID=UPI00143CF3A4|nr:endonuclease/exonuclease/phosphatase family protein [Geobacter sp. FeAm09]